MKDIYTLSDLQNWSDATAGEQPPLRLAVCGDPVAHSASPPMHNAALEHCKIDARYCRLHIRANELEAALRLLSRENFIGTNITLPHKAAALSLMDEVDEHARKIGVVNTVVVSKESRDASGESRGKLIGFNTDGPGFVRAIRAEFGVDVRDLRVMILGAGGGAGRAIATQCVIENCERLVLVNRTLEKAQALAVELSPMLKKPRLFGPVPPLEAVAWENEMLARALQNIDLVVNATPIGMSKSPNEIQPRTSPLPASILRPHLMVFDTIYTAPRTSFMLAADEAGARSANGASMLLFQGALAFEIWFGREAPLDVMRDALRKNGIS